MKKGNILLVDDNRAFIDNVKDILEDEGYNVMTAESGEEALSLTQQISFDLILMDIRMPGLNGVESFIRMKEQDPEVRVILFTAYALEELIQQDRNEGAWAVLKKPLDITRFLKTVEEARQHENGGCILIAEDDQALGQNLFEILTESGYRVAMAGDGLEAIRKAEHSAFNIILLDMKLPQLDGLEVYRRIKSLQPKLVTILMTGYAEEMGDLVHQTINENAYTCLIKPLDMKSLLALLEEVLEARRNGKLTKPGRE